jgi:hypothetical protein
LDKNMDIRALGKAKDNFKTGDSTQREFSTALL